LNYHDLNQKFEATMTHVADFLGLSCPAVFNRPSRSENVVPPILGLADQKILKYYSSEDIEFVERITGPTKERLAAIETLQGA